MRSLVTSLCVCAVLGLGLTGCDDRDNTAGVDTTPDTRRADSTTQPTAGQRVDSAIERTGDAAQRAADRTGEAAGRAVDATTQEARQASDTIRAGATELAADIANGVHNVLAEVTEAAMTENGIDDVAERLSQADRQRLGNIDPAQFSQLNQETTTFRQKWQSKYGKAFDIDDASAVFNFVQIKGDQQDNRRATVTFPARAGMPAVNVPMVREDRGWRIDVPDTLTAQQIADDLTSGIRPINAGDPPLPDDVNEAYHSSAQGTMAALMGERRSQ